MTPYPRLGEVEDIASTVAFLCSTGGSFINGQTIVVDGGWSSTKYLSDFALNSEWVAALNLFALLDQAAARFGDRGAVYLGERQLHTWASCGSGRCGWPARSESGPPGARIAIASENRPGDRRADVRRLGGRVRRRADQLQAASPGDGADPRGRRRGAGVRVAEDRRRADLGHRGADRDRSAPPPTRSAARAAAVGAAARRPIRRRWRGCSTPAAPRAGRRARCCRIAT